ncbi:META domain-containing protein [uncultured Kushneria sp.]|uniref:META domain-containing protein n=1 Tax=uncultured Kushneria sp. TaxID=905033 RepID=UPI00260E78D0|nr:META domain-containing protein [uncultured Kushneria sp.]
MKRLYTALPITGLLVMAGLVGCAGAGHEKGVSPDHDRLGQATLSFDGYRVSGSGGCNRIFGPAQVEQGRLIVGTLASTRMACPGHEEGDQALIDFLESRPRLIQGDNDQWRLENDTQQMAIERVLMQ